MGVFLGPHQSRLARVRVKQYGCLHDTPTVLDLLDLPLRFVFDGLLQEAERVQVLDLPSGTELVRAFLAHRHIRVTAETAFLHVAVTDIDPSHQRVQGFRILDGFFGRAHIGLGHDFQQRRAGTIEINSGHALIILVQGFAGVFLEVGAGQVYDFFRTTGLDHELAAFDDGDFVLTDLVSLGQIRVEVVFAGEYRAAVDRCTDRDTETHRLVDCIDIENGQYSGNAMSTAHACVLGGEPKSVGAPEKFSIGLTVGHGFRAR